MLCFDLEVLWFLNLQSIFKILSERLFLGNGTEFKVGGCFAYHFMFFIVWFDLKNVYLLLLFKKGSSKYK